MNSVTDESVQALRLIARTWAFHPAGQFAAKSLERCARAAFRDREKCPCLDREKPPTDTGVSAL